MIPSIVKVPLSLAQTLTIAVVQTGVRAGVSGATALLHLVLPGEDVAPPRPAPAQRPTPPPSSKVDATPVTQPPAPKAAPTPGVTTTMADPAPATGTPATKKTAKRATARTAPAKKATPKKAAKSATATQKAVAKKTPAKKVAPTKPAATLDEPAAPVDDNPVVYSSGPGVAQPIAADELKDLRPEA